MAYPRCIKSLSLLLAAATLAACVPWKRERAAYADLCQSEFQFKVPGPKRRKHPLPGNLPLRSRRPMGREAVRTSPVRSIPGREIPTPRVLRPAHRLQQRPPTPFNQLQRWRAANPDRLRQPPGLHHLRRRLPPERAARALPGHQRNLRLSGRVRTRRTPIALRHQQRRSTPQHPQDDQQQALRLCLCGFPDRQVRCRFQMDHSPWRAGGARPEATDTTAGTLLPPREEVDGYRAFDAAMS